MPRSRTPGRARALAAALAVALPLGARALGEAPAVQGAPALPPDAATPTATATPTSTPTATASPTATPTLAAMDDGIRAADPSTTTTTTTTSTSTSTSDESLPSLDEIVVVGRRPRGQVARDPTASATVIEAERFAGEAKGVAELVATAPGVAVSDYGGLGHLSTISLRGATADGVLVLLDGVPLNTAFGGGVDLGSIPRQWIDRVEVVRGVEGAIYGAGALGGVVNVVTRGAAARGGSLELGAGSFDTFTASGDRALSLGRATLRVAASADATGGAFPYRWDPTPDDGDPGRVAATRRNDAAARAGGLLAARAPLGRATLDVVALLTAGRRELPGSPYALTPRDRQEDGRALLAARVSGPGPARGLALAGGAALRLDRLDAHVAPASTSQRGAAAGLDGEARWAHGPGLLRAALEAREEVIVGDGLGGRRARTGLAASLSEDVAVGGRVRISPAVRAERVGPFSGVSAKLGASAGLGGPVALRASGGRSFRPPSFAELHLRQGIVVPNPDLSPEEGLGGDAALVLDAAPVYASAGAHATVYRDLVSYQPVSFGQLRPFNTGRSLVRGLELEAATAPVRAAAGLALAASYTLLDTEVLQGPEGTLGRRVPRRARHRLFARAAISPGPASLHAEAHRVGRQYADARNLVVIPAALVWNAGGSLLLSRAHALRVHLELRNLLDDRTLQDALGNPLPGRTVLVSLRLGPTATEGAP